MVQLQSIAKSQLNKQYKLGTLFINTDDNLLYYHNGTDFYQVIAHNINSNIGINTKNASMKFEINDLNGQCLRLVNNDQDGSDEHHCDFKISGNGTLIIKSSNNLIETDKLSLITPLEINSGGTSFNSFNKGEILIGNNNNTLSKLPIGISNGMLLVTDNTQNTGLKWDVNPYLYNPFTYYIYFKFPILLSQTTYSFPYLLSRNNNNNNNNNNIFISNPITINLNTNGLNGLTNTSDNLNGTIYPDPLSTTITGTNTNFITDLVIGDIITVGGSSRKITNIINNTSLTIDSAFSSLNIWSLNGTASLSTIQKKFGTYSLAAANSTSYGRVIDGLNSNFNATSDNWTLEFFIYLSSTTANLNICNSVISNSIALTFNRTGTVLNLSLGQGTTFNIANVATITGAISANIWHHIAIVFDGTSYKVYINGTSGYTLNSTNKITSTAFDNFNFGGNGTTAFNGYIDEIRLSNNIRYSSNFTAPLTAFISDINTIWLNHFERANITYSDDMSYNINLNYTRGGKYYNNSILYTYAIDDGNNPGYILSTRSSETLLIDLPQGYSNTNCKQLPFYIPIQSNGTPFYISKVLENYIEILPTPIIVNNSLNTTVTSYSLANIVPKNCNMVKLLIGHYHVGTISCGIIIGPTSNSSLYQTLLTTSIASNIFISTNILLNSSYSFDCYLSSKASTSNIYVYLQGFYFSN